MNVNDLTLPDLPYDYTALEPVVSETIMKLHHDKHHAGYFKKLVDALKGSEYENKTLEELFESLSSLPKDIQSAVRNNGGGFFNHSLFWNVMSPNGSKITTELTDVLTKSFDSVGSFKEQFTTAAMGVFGSGWAWLVKTDNGLQVTSTPNQDNPLMSVASVKGTPVLGLDVWEHSYYIDYQSDRASYVEKWWSVVNWAQVEKNVQG